MLWLFVGPTGVYLLDLFCSGIQFYLLLSPYLCFISLLYLDLYVLGDQSSRKRRITRIGTHVFSLGRMIFARRESPVRMFF